MFFFQFNALLMKWFSIICQAKCRLGVSVQLSLSYKYDFELCDACHYISLLYFCKTSLFAQHSIMVPMKIHISLKIFTLSLNWTFQKLLHAILLNSFRPEISNESAIAANIFLRSIFSSLSNYDAFAMHQHSFFSS